MKRFSTLSIGDPPLGSQADQAILLQGASPDKGGEFYPDYSGDFIAGGDTICGEGNVLDTSDL